ncbi:MAG: 3-deoxy-D-manno-octulosonic acid transferase [Planctomycetaceae bacterium]|nr:3-deoxy-D-manno-octulosonic acid transferase [Planctomycetaceae bacterium]
MKYLLDAIYATGLVATSPIWLYKMIRHGRYREDIGQRFGAAPRRYGLQPVIWIHGVSLGEVNAARTLVAQLHSQLPDFRVVVSTSTDTGMAAARKLYEPDHMVFRWPLDFSAAVGAALDRVRPAMVVLMEGEAWPNFLAACNKRGIPAVIVNGRMSPDKGYPGYKKLGSLAAKLFNRLAAIGVQDESYAERFRSLGVEASKVRVTGMMKFDSIARDARPAGADALAVALGIRPEDKLIVAGGTGAGEEQIVLDVFSRLTEKHADARLAIVPRKSERFDEVAAQIAAMGMGIIRRSEHPDEEPGTGPGTVPATQANNLPIILGDTMGELRKFYVLAHAVFVGRSLVPMGGSDMIEAAALGKAVAFGPHTFNFPQADALASNGCFRVADAHELESLLDRLLGNPAEAHVAGQAARAYVLSQQGATRRNVEMICDILGRVPAVREGDIATDKIKGNSAP